MFSIIGGIILKDINEIFWNASIQEIKQGYTYDEGIEKYYCLICGKSFEKGIIYPQGDVLYEAEKAIKNHITSEHGSVFEYLVNMNKKYTGLTDVQSKMLKNFYCGLTDKEIVEKQGEGSTSTIRNHRFKLKEKQKQAKIFLSIMDLLNEREANKLNKRDAKISNKEEFVSIHKGATMVDERYAITEKDIEKTIKNYFRDGRLTIFPSKEKRKIIILQHIVKSFEPNRKYSEKEVNEVIKKFYDDYVTLRRYFIQYGFMGRADDCSAYWVKM